MSHIPSKEDAHLEFHCRGRQICHLEHLGRFMFRFTKCAPRTRWDRERNIGVAVAGLTIRAGGAERRLRSSGCDPEQHCSVEDDLRI